MTKDKGQRTKNKGPLMVGLGLCVLLGVAVPLTMWMGWNKQPDRVESQKPKAVKNSEVLPLALLPPESRRSQLEALANDSPSADRNRARYLLAADAIAAGRGVEAVQWLESLEADYPMMAPMVALQRARAWELTGDKNQAQQAWQQLLEKYPQAPMAAEALYALGRPGPNTVAPGSQQNTYWDRAIASFPNHPRTIDIAQARLEQNPNQPQLLLLLAKHGLHLPDIVAYLDRLVSSRNAASLTPADWETIAFAYWEKQEYGKGAAAYAKAPRTPQNAYRAARGLQIDGKKVEAIAAYKRLSAEFPDSEDTAEGLIRLAKILEPKEAITYLDIVRENFPNRAGEALWERSKMLEQLGSASSAVQARKSVLSQHSTSEAAAQLRWQMAQESAASGDLAEARRWAKELREENPHSEEAAEANFWRGKWAIRLGKEKEAQEDFEYVLTHHPESYFAWRSAVYLGWNVGDFTTVRQLQPEVVKPSRRELLPAGEEILQELYLLAQDQDAWTLWQVEFTNRIQPTVPEQFTDGVIRLGVGDNLDGIFMLSSLAWRSQPEEQAQYEKLAQQPAYWQALYPFPYKDLILKWSAQRQLNPLLVTALIRQESRFTPKIKSWAGAVGLMQVLPETAEWRATSMQVKEYDLENPDDNINFGTEFLDYTHKEYSNNSMLAVASYNAGPGAVADWLKRFGFQDPDEFAQKIPFPETNDYIRKVFGNYWNYLRLYNPEVAQKLATLSK
ncbi:lytic transglycosylase domain-containing protein [[Phormidium] sp. ETS-05]|uniref:lytic transglycosylase domain-containing protein n=1 Tax=[Phormidium] sp. ETS-05 TaxID=222819 RepID=UPI0018EF1B63|nr:lytic transglycosylase domain-containing protein [[Phormidium] sp. ETS-05]